jgi:hypothetical protein
MKRPWPVIALPLLICGNATPSRPPATEVLAQQYLASPQPPAPTPELAAQLKFLDSCVVQLIRASDVTYETPQDKITTKIHQFMARCQAENDARQKRK